jgi:hypothetical protein
MNTLLNPLTYLSLNKGVLQKQCKEELREAEFKHQQEILALKSQVTE